MHVETVPDLAIDPKTEIIAEGAFVAVARNDLVVGVVYFLEFSSLG